MSSGRRGQGRRLTGRASPLVSVVVLTRNRAKLLGGCLATLLAQSYPANRTEILVVDDGSTDRTAETVRVLARAHPRLRYVPQPHLGIPAARNRGVRSARGELAAIVADDYLLDPDYLRRAVLFFEQDPKAQVLRFRIQPHSRSISSLVNHFAYEVEFLQRLYPELAWAPRPVRWGFYVRAPRLPERSIAEAPFLEAAGGAVFRRSLFARVGFFDESLARSEDTDFSVRLRRGGTTVHCDLSHPIRHVTRSWLRETLPKRFQAGYYLYQNRRKNRVLSFSGRPARTFGPGLWTIEGLLSIFRMARAAYPWPQALSFMPFMVLFLMTQKTGSFLARLNCLLSGRPARRPRDRAYFSFAGLRVDNITHPQALKRIADLVRSPGQHYVVTPNADHVLLFQKDAGFRDAYAEASLVLPDGISLILASWVMGRPLRERCSGADIFLDVCALCHAHKKRIFLLGGPLGLERRAEAKLRRLFPGIAVAAYSPPFGFEADGPETRKAVKAVRDFRTDVLCLGCGAPKSENWVHRHGRRLGFSLALILGSGLDYFIGSRRRAPAWMRGAGLEWLFRLITEPRRLWKRYVFGIPAFLFLLTKERFKGKRTIAG